MDTISIERDLLTLTLQHAMAFLENLNQTNVSATSELVSLRDRLARPLAERGVDATRVINELVADVTPGLHSSAGGRFFGWVMGGSLPAALAADWLTSTWDQNAALYACSPASAVIEEICGAWLKQLLHLPSHATFALVTGSQMAHTTCLAAARHALLAARDWDVERRGLAGAPPIRVLTSTEYHGSVERAVRLLGLGLESFLRLPVDDLGRLNVEAFEEALNATEGDPTIVVLHAGDLGIAAFDPFAQVIPLAHAKGAWVHVDGAFGLWAAASPRFRHYLTGMDLADSWTTDGHKWLNVPYDCGYAFIADSAAHRASNSHRAQYLTHADDARDQIDWNPEWSRRARGFSTYAAIRELGRDGIADLIERTCAHAHDLATRIASLPGTELVWEPTLNQGLVRFLDPSATATDGDHDRRTDDVINAIASTGEAFFTGTTWRKRRCMRISVINWRTTEADVDRSVAAVQHALEIMT